MTYWLSGGLILTALAFYLQVRGALGYIKHLNNDVEDICHG